MSRIEELSQYLCDLLGTQESFVIYRVPICSFPFYNSCNISKGLFPLYAAFTHDNCRQLLEQTFPIQRTYWQRHLLVRSEQINNHECAIHWTTGPLQGVCEGCTMIHERETHRFIATLCYLRRALLPELAIIIVGILIHFFAGKLNAGPA